MCKIKKKIFKSDDIWIEMHTLCHHLVHIINRAPECVGHHLQSSSWICTLVLVFVNWIINRSILFQHFWEWNGKWNVKWKTKRNKMEKGKFNIKFIDLKGYRLDRTDFQCFKIDIHIVSLRSKPLLTKNMDAPWSSLQSFAESSVNIANLCTAILKVVLLFIGQHYLAHKHFKGQLLQIFKKLF